MKTATNKILYAGIIILMLSVTISSFAWDINEINGSPSKEYFDQYFEQDGLISSINEELHPGYSIMIYSAEGDLLVSGNQSDVLVKKYMRKSYLLTEVNGLEFYIYNLKNNL